MTKFFYYLLSDCSVCVFTTGALFLFQSEDKENLEINDAGFFATVCFGGLGICLTKFFGINFIEVFLVSRWTR